jgi:hypothetical protein
MVVQPPVTRRGPVNRRSAPLIGGVCLVAVLSVAGILVAYLGWSEPPVRPKCHAPSSRLASTGHNPYDRLTLGLRPVAYYNVEVVDSEHGTDVAGCSPAASLVGLPGGRSVLLPDGESAGLFTSKNALEIPSRAWFSIRNTGRLTLEAWIRPSTLAFRRTESSGYVNWLGKGAPGSYEYGLRMYSAHNQEARGNRISGYAFNLDGGKGSGSYFQDDLEPQRWIFVTVVLTTKDSEGYPANTVTIYKDGVRRMTTPLSQFGVDPQSGDAPLRIGSTDDRSYFEGAITKVAVFDRALSPSSIRKQMRLMHASKR